MAVIDIYLQIEPIEDYNPVLYAKDCLRSPGHENAKIPPSEIQARKLRAVVYREYVNESYTVRKPDKLIITDSTEPGVGSRIGTAIYVAANNTLKIHVHNTDDMPHSFHVHGLKYGIDSDGSWPFGLVDSLGRRSDQICTDEIWTYTYEITDDMIGAWPFHDHYRNIHESINMGLFGGIIVVPELTSEWVPPAYIIPTYIQDAIDSTSTSINDLLTIDSYLPEYAENAAPVIAPTSTIHAPIFLHTLGEMASTPVFDTGIIPSGANSNIITISPQSPTVDLYYHCSIHPTMTGKIQVKDSSNTSQEVDILDDAGGMRFQPDSFEIAPGGTIKWKNQTPDSHTATQGSLNSFCFNGRTFVGNSPVIEVSENQPIRFYVFNLDLSETWHNFHTHGMKWKMPNLKFNLIAADNNLARQDVRSIGPAESFVVDTIAPKIYDFGPVIEGQNNPMIDPPGDAIYINIFGDFLFHCHVEHHMMNGLVGLVRVLRTLWVTPEQLEVLNSEIVLPLYYPGGRPISCPDGSINRCEDIHMGTWDYIRGSDEINSLPGATMMHMILIPQTNKVLFFGYFSLSGNGSQDSYILDIDNTTTPYSRTANQPYDLVPAPSGGYTKRQLANLWSSEHAFLKDSNGTIVIHGGFTADFSSTYSSRLTFLFHPDTIDTAPWEFLGGSDYHALTNLTNEGRYYSATISLADGTPMTLIGTFRITSAVSYSYELFDIGASPNMWGSATSLDSLPFNNTNQQERYVYYPWTFLLPNGQLLIAGPKSTTFKFDPFDLGDVQTISGARTRDYDNENQEGTAVLLPLRLIDNYTPKVLVAGGEREAEMKSAQLLVITEEDARLRWTDLPPLTYKRKETTGVLLLDGNILICGGAYSDQNSGTAIPGQAEIFDTETYTWMLGGTCLQPRVYHNSAILLPDGSVVMGGDTDGNRNGGQIKSERFKPPYYFLDRPKISDGWAQPDGTWTEHFNLDLDTEASEIISVAFVRPGSVTHGYNMSQRFIECEFTVTSEFTLDVTYPPDGFLAPPGWYLLVVISGGVCYNDSCNKIPSIAKWIRIKN